LGWLAEEAVSCEPDGDPILDRGKRFGHRDVILWQPAPFSPSCGMVVSRLSNVDVGWREAGRTVQLDRRTMNYGAHNKLALLEGHPLFREFGLEDRRRLANCATSRHVERGKTIFSKGEIGGSLFAVCSGTVEVLVPSAEGKTAVVKLIGEGEIFGEIALLDGGPRSADAVAFSDCQLMAIERRDFLALLRANPEVAITLLKVLCARLRRTTEQVEDLMFLDLKSRLVKTLLRLARSANPEGRIIISQSELSQIVGLSREMINKQLQIWAREGWITLARRCIVVKRPDALARVVADA
jgi:CRP-like cAMP-binding protein